MTGGAADHRPLIGIGLMVLSCAFLATKDGLAKTFLDQVGPFHMIWFQYVGNLAVMAMIAAPRHGWAIVRPRPLGWQMFRGAASAAAVATLYWALTYIPLADATAMFMLAPVVVTALAPLVLGERIGWRRMLAIGVGLLGVLVILRPGLGGSAPGYYIALAAGVLLALYFLANRKLAGAAPPLVNVTHNALTGAIALTAFAPLYWQPVPIDAAPKLALLIGLAVVGQACMISAFNYAPAPVVAPYTYAMLVFAAAIGYVAFGAFPDLATWTGIALIVSAGLYIAYRERQLAAQRSRGYGVASRTLEER